MRIARKLFLLAAMAVAAMAFTASSAVAQETPVEVEELGGTHCGDVTLETHVAHGGCELHATNEGLINLFQHQPEGSEETPPADPVNHPEVNVLQCNNEFDININSSGEGWVTNQVISPGGINCGTAVRECRSSDFGGPTSEDLPWHIQIGETGGPSDEQEHGIVEVCLRIIVIVGGQPVACPLSKEVEVDLIRQQGGGYEAVIDEQFTGDVHLNPCGLDSEFGGHYTFEHTVSDYTELEIHHLDD